MKEVVMVELERSDIEAAIEDLLKEKGYQTDHIEFTYDFKKLFLAGAVVKVLPKKK